MKMEDVNERVEQKRFNKNEKVEKESLSFCEITGFPSKNKFYSGSEIKGRPLRIDELKKLSTMTEENSDSVINEVLKNSIKGISIDKVLSADKLYFIFWLRANTYREPGYTVNFECKLCNKESSYDFNLNNLQVKYLSDEFSFDNLSFTLSNGDKIDFHLSKIEDEKVMNKFINTYRSIIKNIDDNNILFSVLIDKINGEEKEILEKYEYITDLNPLMYSQLKTKIKKWDFGIKTQLNVTCNKCGGLAPVGIMFQEEFFIPDYNDERTSNNDV